MTLTVLAAVACGLALLPAVLFLLNLRIYRPPALVREADASDLPPVSVLIPARNEGQGIGAAVAAALASKFVDLEVIVLDDHSEDDTAAVVRAIAARDDRVRLEVAPPLPPGWAGKQHACHVLGGLATHPYLVFLDADVRLRPDALARMLRFMERTGADLASGIPRQITGTLVERLVLPLIHFVLLGFLPMDGMRRFRSPAFSAGCGQLFVARREAYDRAGGHASVRDSFHDGVKLPRAFRRAGLVTDLFDATGLADCRMYTGAAALWRGLAKNAREGLAAPAMLVPATLLLLGGQVLPALLLPFTTAEPTAFRLTAAALALAYLPRLLGAWHFRQSWLGAILHPVGILFLLAIQWYAAACAWLGRPLTWKGRPQVHRVSETREPALR